MPETYEHVEKQRDRYGIENDKLRDLNKRLVNGLKGLRKCLLPVDAANIIESLIAEAKEAMG